MEPVDGHFCLSAVANRVHDEKGPECSFFLIEAGDSDAEFRAVTEAGSVT